MVDRQREFRFFYFTSKYDETVAFYRESLGLETYRSWDRVDGDRGTIFVSPAGNGLIEIEQGSDEPTLGGGLYIEVDDIDAWYERAKSARVPIARELSVTSYRHRNFKIVDPNGFEISLFSYLRP